MKTQLILVLLASIMISCSCEPEPTIIPDIVEKVEKNEILSEEIDSLYLAKEFNINVHNDSLVKNVNHPENSEIYINKSPHSIIGHIFGNNSTIYINSNLSECHIVLLNATVLGDLRIIANGTNGSDGNTGDSHPNNALTDYDGATGNTGGRGVDGTNGVNLNIEASFKKIDGKITISSKGGNGGNGGKGGQGQKGGKADCLPPASAGKGGKGGTGGNGGNAGRNGDIIFKFINRDIDGNSGRVSFLDETGIAGVVGPGGDGGIGGDGAKCGLYKRGTGPNGPVGDLGLVNGNAGIKGKQTLIAPK